jgi:hypothetical protein
MGLRLADEYRATVDVEDLAGDEAGEGSAEEEDGCCDLFDVRGAAEGDQGEELLRYLGVVEDVFGGFGGDPAGGDAVAVDALADEFCGEGFGEADEGAFGGGVVGMESFAALAGGGADEDDVASGGGSRLGVRLGFHLGHGGADDTEDAVEVGAEGAAPLVGGHLRDGGVVRRPDAMVEDGAVDTAEGGGGGDDEGFAVFRGVEGLVDGAAEVGTSALGDEGFCLFGCGAVVEDDLRASLAEEADGGGPDSAGATGDEGYFACERHGDARVETVRHIVDAIESISLTQVLQTQRIFYQIHLRGTRRR